MGDTRNMEADKRELHAVLLKDLLHLATDKRKPYAVLLGEFLQLAETMSGSGSAVPLLTTSPCTKHDPNRRVMGGLVLTGGYGTDIPTGTRCALACTTNGVTIFPESGLHPSITYTYGDLESLKSEGQGRFERAAVSSEVDTV
jgi:hypothetical protein